MATTNINALDGLEGIETPDQVQESQDQEFARSQGGAGPVTSSQAIFGAASRAGHSLFGNPRLARAQNTQQALVNAISDSDANAPKDEDGIDGSMRRLKAAYTAVADKSPQAAMQISNKIALLQQAKSQQSKLNEGIDAQTAAVRKSNASTDLELIQKGTRVIGNAKTGKQYGTVRVFDEQGNMVPGWQQQVAQIKAQSGDPDAQDVQQDQWFNNKYQIESLKSAERMARDAQKQANAMGLTPEGLQNLTAAHAIFGDSALSRRNNVERDAVTNLEAKAGVTPVDMAAARSELKAVMSNAGAQGRREGNVDYLSQSIPGFGENVLKALDGVDRTSVTGLNALIRLGKTKGISTAGEQVYAASLQSFVSEYARVINGGTGQSTDGAREEAWNVLGKDSSPEAMKAAIKFLVEKETSVLKNATPLALDALRNPQYYKAALKIQEKLGIPMLQQADQVGAGALGSDPDAQQGAAAQQAAPQRTVVKFGELK